MRPDFNLLIRLHNTDSENKISSEDFNNIKIYLKILKELDLRCKDYTMHLIEFNTGFFRNYCTAYFVINYDIEAELNKIPIAKIVKKVEIVKNVKEVDYVKYYEIIDTFWYDSNGSFSGCIGDESN